MESKQSVTGETQQASNSNGGWLFPLFLAGILLLLFGFSRWLPGPMPPQQAGLAAHWTPSPLPKHKTVGLTIDFGNGAKKEYAALPWHEKMTVADLLVAAQKFRPGIQFLQVGRGEQGFLSSLGGLANEGAGGRNWLYQVDGRHAHVSFCLEKLVPGMHVLWSFTDERYNDKPPE